MTTVRYQWARRQVALCIAALADAEYQARVWVRHDPPRPDYYDELDLQIHVLFDDFEVLPEPRTAVDGVLVPGDEISRLRELGAALDPMIDRLSEVAESDADYLADPLWPAIVDLAQRCLAAFVLAGGWEYTESDAEAYSKDRVEARIPTVELPATRRRVIQAVAALADKDYQRRTWTGDAGDPVTGSLGACLHTLTDDAHVVPEPANAIGRVLLPGDEVDRLVTLYTALAPFTNETPRDAHDDERWGSVISAALHCLPALVIAGAWIGPDPT